MLRTIETDMISPFGEPEVPAAEWTYRAWRAQALEQGAPYVRAALGNAARMSGHTFDTMPEFPRGQSLGWTVYAYVNDGRWLWDCPICRAAQVCAADDRRAFCVECFNGGDGWWPVMWPDPALVDAAAVVLDARPSDDRRNWTPRIETLRDLQHENLAHGIDPDAPGFEIIGNPAVLAQVKQRLDELGYPMIEGPEDELLTLPPAELQRALAARVERRALDAAERDQETGDDDVVDDA